MIVGLILVGCMVGAVAALGALLLGQGVLIALLIYSGTGCACVLALALCAALRPEREPDTAPPARVQRG